MPARLDRDEELLEALRQSEPTAAERLGTTFWGRAYRLAIRITGHKQDADEVVQDAFWAVVRKIHTFRGESAFGSWPLGTGPRRSYEGCQPPGQIAIASQLDEDEIANRSPPGGWHVLLWAGLLAEVDERVHRGRAGPAAEGGACWNA